jgi:hypothetical protein
LNRPRLFVSFSALLHSACRAHLLLPTAHIRSFCAAGRSRPRRLSS